MTFLLSSKNVFDYLVEEGICEANQQSLLQIEPKSGKNFNLLVSLTEDRYFLIKQERHDHEGKTNGDFWYEWLFYDFLQKFPELSSIRPLISEAIHFDSSRSILVFNYLNDYCDLAYFYSKEQVFPTNIASQIGATIATIHRTTLDCQQYKDFLNSNSKQLPIDEEVDFLERLERIEPDVFGIYSEDSLEFFRLYQRYESLGQALAELNQIWDPCCLIHNDLKLKNILLHLEWEQCLSSKKPEARSIVRVIDWEKFTWGDPSLDLGTIIASYLQIWLSSLVISTAIDVETALRLATTPLEVIQPSLVALTQAYLAHFPEIIERRQNFLRRAMQFAGFVLIRKIHIKINNLKPFDNRGICMLQVAKTLLCHPEQSIEIVFGITESELTFPSRIPA
ncbi:phosphotransferase family protein [Moorena producens]|uniref:phosphotransferase family protein n=1 Tax=Moorena producens TaxID=1155739 RepID=UPI003C76D231